MGGVESFLELHYLSTAVVDPRKREVILSACERRELEPRNVILRVREVLKWKM